jgi:hypothetical protein
MELIRLNQELDLSVHEAHATNAAVAAVAQVLASKQAAALRAREAAGNATKRLRRFMAELDTQVRPIGGWLVGFCLASRPAFLLAGQLACGVGRCHASRRTPCSFPATKEP